VEDNLDEQTGFPAAMNQSIYLMLGIPYTALFVAGYFIYRGMRQNDAYRQRDDHPQSH
jgi:hypothetical protein